MSYIGNTPGVSSQRFVQRETVSGSAKSLFVVSSGYSLGYVDVFVNGVQLDESDFTATDGVSVTLGTAAAVGDIVRIIAWLPRGLSDGYLKSEADARYLQLTGGALTGALTSSGSFSTSSANGYNVQLSGGNAYRMYATTNDLVFRSVTAGSDVMTLTYGGNVGIGTSSPGQKLEVANTSGSVAATLRSSNSGYSELYFARVNDNAAGAVSYEHSSNMLRLYNGGSARVLLDPSGNLGLGVTPTNAYGKLQANASGTVLPTGDSNVPAGYSYAQFNANNSAVSDWLLLRGPYGTAGHKTGILLQDTFYDNSAYGGRYIQANGQALTFGLTVNGTLYSSNQTLVEHARIDASGNLLVGTTSSQAKFTVDGVGGSSNQTMLIKGWGFGIGGAATWRTDVTWTGNADVMYFNVRGSNVGTISLTNNGTATSYNTSSDYRLKHDIAPMTGALAKVAQLKPVTYKWNADNSDGEGFIAHELQAVVPQAVTGEKDAVDADGKPQYQGIDTSFLVATLTAAIQELKAIVDAQAERIAVLENA